MITLWKPQFKKEDMEILDEKTIYDGIFQVKHLQIRFPLFEGGHSATISRTVLNRNPAVAVLLYDPKQDKVVLIEQIRVGAYKSEESPWLLEIVAGLVDTNETFDNTALRESEEEAGLKVQSLIPICQYRVSPGISTEETKVYCGIVELDGRSTQNYFGLAEESENIKIHVLSFAEAKKLLEEGAIISASAVIAMQWLIIHHHTFQP